MTFAPLAEAANGTAKRGDGSTICDFSTFSFNTTSNTLDISCMSTVQPGGPSAYSIVGGSAVTAYVNTQFSASIQRTGGLAAETLTLAHDAGGILGWSFNGSFTGSQTISFAAGETSKTLLFDPGPAAGFLKFTLQSVNPAGSTGLNASQQINVSASAPPPVNNGPTPIPGCSTTATKNDVFVNSSQKVTMSLKAGETGAVAFTPTATSIQMYLSSSETVNTPTDADHEVAISTCPGDFTPSYPCSYQANYVGNSQQAKVGASPWQCPLQVGKTYYMNVRHVKLRDPVNWKSIAPQNSCLNPPQYTAGACEVRLQNTGL